MDNYMIEMIDICKSFGNLKANDNITLKLKKGEIHALLGENGAGKSTLMSILFGLYQADSGVIKIDGEVVDIKGPKDANKYKIGMVHQHFKLVEVFTVLENITLAPVTLKLKTKEQAIEDAYRLLDKIGLRDKANVYPSTLSGGQKQRVSIARALVTKPKIILADEPTGALDSSTGKAVLELFNQINDEGTTIVIVTHDPGIGASTKRCIRILDGQVAEDKVNNNYHEGSFYV